MSKPSDRKCPSEQPASSAWIRHTSRGYHGMLERHVFTTLLTLLKASLLVQMVKNLPAMQETWVQPLGWEDPLEKGKATHSSILAWKIPWTEGPGGIQSMGSQRVRHYWATKQQHISHQSWASLQTLEWSSKHSWVGHFNFLLSWTRPCQP